MLTSSRSLFFAASLLLVAMLFPFSSQAASLQADSCRYLNVVFQNLIKDATCTVRLLDKKQEGTIVSSESDISSFGGTMTIDYKKSGRISLEEGSSGTSIEVNVICSNNPKGGYVFLIEQPHNPHPDFSCAPPLHRVITHPAGDLTVHVTNFQGSNNSPGLVRVFLQKVEP